MSPGATQEQVDYYVDLFKKVRETPEWKDFMEKGAFNTTFMSGKEFRDWVSKAADTHRGLMEKAGFMAPKS
jgi:putative tricarboxylic transport membrane protein